VPKKGFVAGIFWAGHLSLAPLTDPSKETAGSFALCAAPDSIANGWN
jgi:hypothetical protein